MPITVQSLEEWSKSGVKDMLSVVIPAHDEEACIEQTIRELADTLSNADIPFEILVINDNSTDRTEDILKLLESEIEGVRYLNNEPPNGFGFAVRAGLSSFRGECVAIMMADASDDPKDLLKYYEKWKEGYDCVFGTRFDQTSTCTDYPILKLILNRSANFLIRCLFWIKYNDTTNAFKLYSRSALAGFQPILSHHFNLTVELPLKAITRGYKYTVVPNNWYGRTSGVSKFGIKELGSRYVFIIMYCWLEKRLSRGDYHIDKKAMRHSQLQVWHR